MPGSHFLIKVVSCYSYFTQSLCNSKVHDMCRMECKCDKLTSNIKKTLSKMKRSNYKIE